MLASITKISTNTIFLLTKTQPSRRFDRSHDADNNKQQCLKLKQEWHHAGQFRDSTIPCYSQCSNRLCGSDYTAFLRLKVPVLAGSSIITAKGPRMLNILQILLQNMPFSPELAFHPTLSLSKTSTCVNFEKAQ